MRLKGQVVYRKYTLMGGTQWGSPETCTKHLGQPHLILELTYIETNIRVKTFAKSHKIYRLEVRQTKRWGTCSASVVCSQDPPPPPGEKQQSDGAFHGLDLEKSFSSTNSPHCLPVLTSHWKAATGFQIPLTSGLPFKKQVCVLQMLLLYLGTTLATLVDVVSTPEYCPHLILTLTN